MFFICLAAWYLFCGRITVENTLIGIAVSYAVYCFACHHLRYDPDTDVKLAKNLPRALRYAIILVWETLKANLAVIEIVYSPKIELQPELVFFRSPLKSQLARVVLANSITLTPGTITVALADDIFCVHSLNEAMGVGLGDSVFVHELLGFEQAPPPKAAE